jgi:hypothetical protein
MKKRLILMGVIIGLLALAASQVATTQAAPQRTTASFGVMLKPGWGGGEDAPYNYTAILVLRCALLNRSRTRQPGITTVVITGTNLALQRGATCANFPMWGMGDGNPIGEETPFVPYAGTTDTFPQRREKPNP